MGVPGASGTQTCGIIETMSTCFNTKGADCEDAALAQFNTMVDIAKKPTCEADGTCVNHTLCTGAEGELASGARSSSSWSLMTMVCCAIFSLFFVVDACDVSGLQQCQSDYMAAVPGASGTQTCEAISNMKTCFNTKGADCEAAALTQFNTMVDTAKKPTCEADGTCVNHTLCTGAEGELASGAPTTWPRSFITLVGATLALWMQCRSE